MPYFPRFGARRSLNAATAEELLAGRGVPGDAPAGQQALARLLEIAARPGTERELVGEVAAAAAFVQATSRVGSRRLTRRILAAAACAMAVGGAATYVTMASHPLHKVTPIQFGGTPPVIPAPRVTSSPSPQPGAPRTNPGGGTGYPAAHPAIGPSVQPHPCGR